MQAEQQTARGAMPAEHRRAAAGEDPVTALKAALAALDRALAARPERTGRDFAEATGHLCRARRILIARSAEDGRRSSDLGTLNAIISTVLAGHFPLGKTPWPEVEHARGALHALIDGLRT